MPDSGKTNPTIQSPKGANAMKIINAVILSVLLLLLLFAACAQKVNDPADIQAIKDLLVSLNKAYAAGDADAVVSTYYADNAIRMSTFQPAVVGKEAIRAYWKSRYDNYTVVWQDNVEDIRVTGDWAVVRGSGSGTYTYKATGMSRPGKGKWIAIYERQSGGGWKCVSDCVNGDLPLTDSLPIGSEEIALMKIEQVWGAAMVKNDSAAMDKMLASEYSSNAEGTFMSKRQLIANMKSGAYKVTSLQPGEMKALVIGDTAIVHGSGTEKSTLNGKDTSGTYRYTDVFAKRDGQWLAVSTYATKVK